MDLFSKSKLPCGKSGDNSEVSVILGGCYRELVSEAKLDEFLSTLRKFILDLKSKNQYVYYIPHPREGFESDLLSSINPIYPKELTEFYLLSLLDSYSIVNLYGFGSSAQLNLVNTPGILVNILKHTYINERYDTELLFSNFEYKTVQIG